MKRRFQLAFLATALVALGSVPAQAVNLLSGGDFEVVGGEIPSWTLEEFASGSGTVLNTAELVDWTIAAHSGSFGLWLRAFEGGRTTGPDNLTNAILWQSVPAVVGENYTFSGHVAFEGNYSGSMDWLAALATGDPADVGPLAGQPSPTSTNLELAFLDAGDSVIGTPTTVELGPIVLPFGDYEKHSVSGVAPSGTVRVRVTAQATDMVFNIDPSQSAFYDDFSLTGAASPATELLANPDLEDPPASPLDNWTVTVFDPNGTHDADILRIAGGSANHTPGGGTGVWLSSWPGEPGTEVDGMISQTAPGVEDGNYTFSGWSNWEVNYSGGLDTPTETFMELAFLDGSGVVIGDPISLDLRDEQVNDAGWAQHSLNGVSPTGTASVRVSAGMIDGLFTQDPDQSAFFDDFVLELAVDFDADFDNDGDVDGNDFLLWQSGFPTPSGAVKMDGDADNDGDVDGNDFLIWQTEFPSPGSGAGSSAVPEPGTGVLALLAAGLLTIGRRRTT